MPTDGDVAARRRRCRGPGRAGDGGYGGAHALAQSGGRGDDPSSPARCPEQRPRRQQREGRAPRQLLIRRVLIRRWARKAQRLYAQALGLSPQSRCPRPGFLGPPQSASACYATLSWRYFAFGRLMKRHLFTAMSLLTAVSVAAGYDHARRLTPTRRTTWFSNAGRRPNGNSPLSA
jgi:hypothetical protein